MTQNANDFGISTAVVVAREDVQSVINSLDVDRFILFPLKARTSNPQALAELITRVASLVDDVTEARKAEKLKSLVELLTPDIQTSDVLVREARMIATARQAVLKNAQWITAEQLSELVGFSPTNPSAQPNKWKSKKMIFAIHDKGTDYFPVYALDPDKNHRPVEALAKILDVFGNRKDGWGLAYWFVSANGYLGGQRPQDLLQSDPEAVLKAAGDEIAGITHG